MIGAKEAGEKKKKCISLSNDDHVGYIHIIALAGECVGFFRSFFYVAGEGSSSTFCSLPSL